MSAVTVMTIIMVVAMAKADWIAEFGVASGSGEAVAWSEDKGDCEGCGLGDGEGDGLVEDAIVK